MERRTSAASENSGSARASLQGVSGGTLIKVVADRSVEKLGFEPVGALPGWITVAKLAEDGWAARQGVKVGDVLQSLGQTSTQDLTKDEIRRRLEKDRPLRLVFLRPALPAASLSLANPEKNVDDHAKELLEKIGAARQALRVAAAEATTLDDKLNGELKGPATNGHSNGHQEAVPTDALVALAAVAKDLGPKDHAEDTFGEDESDDDQFDAGSDLSAPADAVWPGEEDLPFTIEIAEGTRMLGFGVVGEPPGRVYVKRVDPDGFAAQEGVEVDDIVLLLDETIASYLTKKDLVARMRKRPLKITFLRKIKDGGPPPKETHVVAATMLLGQALLSNQENANVAEDEGGLIGAIGGLFGGLFG